MPWDLRGIHDLDEDGLIIRCLDNVPCSTCDCRNECKVLLGDRAGEPNGQSSA